jgi:membrane associated rhomboid family serine protease
MDILEYIGISILVLVAGAIAGSLGGLCIGWLLAFSYHRRGPSDPADAPVYVAMGLTVVGACVGAVAGFIIGIIYSVRLERGRKSLHQPHQSETGSD